MTNDMPAATGAQRESRSGTAGMSGLTSLRLGGIWLLVAALPVIAIHLLATGSLGRRSATVGEANITAAAFALAQQDALPPAIPLPDVSTVYQLAALNVLIGPLRSGTVMADVRATALAVGLLSSLLLWPVARRLQLAAAPAAAAVLVTGVPTVVGGLHGAVDAGALAGLWLTVAAALPAVNYALRALSVLAVGVAVLTAALAGVALLAFLAHLVFAGTILGRLPGLLRAALGTVLAGGAVGLALLAIGDRPLAATGDGAVPPSVVAGVLAIGAVLCVVAWLRLRWARSIVAAAVALICCAAVPAASATTAAILVVPLLGILLAGLLEELGELGGARRRRPWLATVGALVAVAVAVLPAMPAAAAQASRSQAAEADSLARWIENELDPAALLAVDGLTWAQLVRDGIPARRLVPVGPPLATGPPPPDVLLVPTPRPGHRQGPSWDRPSVLLAAMDSGPGDARTEIRRSVSDPQATAAAAALDADDRRRVGSLLATNRSLILTDLARQQLRDGAVDARLITVLAGFAALHRLEIAEFLGSAAEPPDAPLRTVRITAVDDKPPSELLQRWLEAQLPPYRPLWVHQTDGGLVVRYSAPCPLGLLAR